MSVHPIRPPCPECKGARWFRTEDPRWYRDMDGNPAIMPAGSLRSCSRCRGRGYIAQPEVSA
jgi:hypothetical protein